MTNEVKNVPELRFPGFEDEWKINLFGELVTNKSDKYLPKNNEQLIDIELDSIESNTGRLIHKYNSSHFSSQKHKFNKNQVLYSKLRPYLNKYYFTNFNGVCSSEIWVLNTKSDLKLINEFIYNFIQTNKFSQIANKSAGSKMPRADWNLVENIRFNIPILKEQEKIGSFFSKLDRQIELEEQKLEKLEEQKKGYMQKVFTQELRFTDDNGNEYPNWEKEEIQDLMEVTSVKRIHQSDWQSNGVPFLRARDIVAYNKGEEIKEPLFISYDKYNEHSSISGKVEKGDLLVTGVGTIGVPFLIKDNTPLYFKDGNIIWLKNRGNLDENFLFYSFLNANIQNYIKRVAGVGTVGTYTIANAKKTPIFEPTKLEQEKIGNFFINLDSIIEKQSSKVELLKHRKQGLLQKMFV